MLKGPVSSQFSVIAQLAEGAKFSWAKGTKPAKVSYIEMIELRPR
jgi:hypothetical protein